MWLLLLTFLENLKLGERPPFLILLLFNFFLLRIMLCSHIVILMPVFFVYLSIPLNTMTCCSKDNREKSLQNNNVKGCKYEEPAYIGEQYGAKK